LLPVPAGPDFEKEPFLFPAIRAHAKRTPRQHHRGIGPFPVIARVGRKAILADVTLEGTGRATVRLLEATRANVIEEVSNGQPTANGR
jgi:hypothetical protein